MLACDSGLHHRFTAASTDSFARHFRAESYSGQRDRRAYSAMYTEGEPKEKLRRLETMSPSQTSPVMQSASHGCEAPPQLSPEVLPPASAAHTPAHTSQPVSPSSKHSMSANVATPSYPPVLHLSEGKSEQFHHHHHQQHLQHSSYKEDENTPDAQNERGGHNSDSDSSSVNGITDGSRRYREFVPDDQKDEVYWEKRRKNNEAARKSREKRRMHDMVLEGRITSLEDDNSKLRRELFVLKKKFNLPEEQTFYDRDVVAKESIVHGVIGNSSPPITNHIQTSLHDSPVGGVCKPSANIPYSSPPPLLAVAEAMPMGVAMYSGNPKAGLPYILSEASRMNHDGTLKTLPPSLATGHHLHQQQQISNQHLHHSVYQADLIKDEPIEAGEVRVRSNSSVERRPNYHIDPSETSFLRRGSVGNYSQYRPPLSPPIAQISHHPYSSSPSNHAHYLQRTYDSHPLSLWSQRSPLSSHSSDDNYDEPLQLTVRRDSSVSVHSSSYMDDNSKEGDSSAAAYDKSSVSVSPPASSFPLKLRHKLPSHDVAYPKEMFPTISPAAVSVTQSSFPTHPFMNGITHLSDLTLTQANPLSLVKVESPSYTHRKDVRAGSRRNPTDSKYLDPKYLERRRRNNEAARKCRENRKTLTKIREAKSNYLETENSKLRDELTSLQEEMKQLRELIEKKRLEQGIKDEPHVES